MKSPRELVLIAPLDWGLGHATRCIPIIEYLVETKRRVVIAADGRPRKLLEAEFPELQIISLPGYDIRYPANGSMTVAIARQFPKILRGIWNEHRWLKRWVEREKPALVISDNRFGLFNKSIPTIYITHQLNIMTPARLTRLQPILRKLHTIIIEQFAECWIPDYETAPGLAGALSHGSPLPVNAKYIGPLSRFHRQSPKSRQISLYDEVIDLLVILSGPEPQRSIFEQIILEQLPKTGLRALVAEGRSEEDTDEWITDRIRVVSRMTSQDLQLAITRSSAVLARPGYSTIMDLAITGKQAIFVPTPGQTEQEYLGSQLNPEWGSIVIQQDKFDLVTAWHDLQKPMTGSPPYLDPTSFIPLLESYLRKKPG